MESYALIELWQPIILILAIIGFIIIWKKNQQ